MLNIVNGIKFETNENNVTVLVGPLVTTELPCSAEYLKLLLKSLDSAFSNLVELGTPMMVFSDNNSEAEDSYGGMFSCGTEGVLKSVYSRPFNWTESKLKETIGGDDVVLILEDKALSPCKCAIFITDISTYDGDYYEQLTMFAIRLNEE